MLQEIPKKASDSNGGAPVDDDEDAQVDGPSEDGAAAGDNSTLQVLISVFLIELWTSGSSSILASIWKLRYESCDYSNCCI